MTVTLSRRAFLASAAYSLALPATALAQPGRSPEQTLLIRNVRLFDGLERRAINLQHTLHP